MSVEPRRGALLAQCLVFVVGLAASAPNADARVSPRIQGPVEDLVVDGPSAYYRSSTAKRELVRRVDLITGRATTLYAVRHGRFSIEALRARRGQVAVGLDTILGRQVEPGVQLRGSTKVVVLSPRGRAPKTLASGRFKPGEQRDCGNHVLLRDVDSDGGVLIEEEEQPCSRLSGGSLTLKRYASRGPEILQRRDIEEDVALEGFEDVGVKLVSDHLLRWEETVASVTDLATGQRREVRPNDRRSGIWHADVDGSGNLLVTEASTRRGSLTFTSRVFPPGGPPDGRRLSMPATGTDVRFCADRLVIYRLGRLGRDRLTVRERWDGSPRTVVGPRRRPRQNIGDMTCDSRRFVTAIVERAERYSDGIIPTRLRLEVVALRRP